MIDSEAVSDPQKVEETTQPETDLKEEDIKLVIEQANVSRSAAISALLAKNNDVIDALLHLNSPGV